MPRFNRSPLAFEDCKAIFDQAMDSKSGIQVRCQSYGEAYGLKTRLNTYRAMDREENRKIYQPDDRMYGNSAYDRLVIQLAKRGAKDDHVVWVMPRLAKKWDVHPISGPEPPVNLDDLMRDLTGKTE